MPTLWDDLLPLTRRLYGHVLDAGCGNGMYSRRLHEIAGVTGVTSLDLEFEPFAHDQPYRDNCPQGTFVQGDIQNLSLFRDDSFDCAMAWHVIEHTRYPGIALRGLCRVTRDLLMLALPVKGNGAWDSEGHVQFWTAPEFRRFLLSSKLVEVVDQHIDCCGAQNWLLRKAKRAT